MSSVGYYRSEAERCRELAASSPDPEAARRWRSIAADYERLAEAFSEAPHVGMTAMPMQQQPMQQQQSKTEEPNKED